MLSKDPPDYPRATGADYFRRGPRSEETFFSFDLQSTQALVEGYLATRNLAHAER